MLNYVTVHTRVLIFILMLSITSCASDFVRHGFHFNAGKDSPDIRILDFQYGTSKHPGARATQRQKEMGRVPQTAGVTGGMRRGDELYVKWKVKSTGLAYEETVDLKQLLPPYIKGHKIRFIVSGSQLNVYLISPYKLLENPCPSWEKQTEYFKSINPDDKMFASYCSFLVYKINPSPKKSESKSEEVKLWLK